MGNTPRIKPIAKPVEDDDIELWDQFVQDAAPNVKPWRKKLPEDGGILEIACPSSDQVDDLGEAQQIGDVQGMLKALIGDEDTAEKVIELTRKTPYTVRVRIVNDVMLHYGMDLARLPE